MTVTGLADRLGGDLRAALRRRDRAAVGVLRSVLATIANAEAVPVDDVRPRPTDGPIAGASAGLGATEAPRRVLSEEDVRALVAGERDELLAAAGQAAQAAPERAEQLRAGAALLDAYL